MAFPVNFPRSMYAITFVNPSRPLHFSKLYQNKNRLKFLFSHFFVVPQKAPWRIVKMNIDLIFSLFFRERNGKS